MGSNTSLAYLTWNAFAQWLLGRSSLAAQLQDQRLDLVCSHGYLLSMDTGLAVSGAFLMAVMGEYETAGVYASGMLEGRPAWKLSDR